MINAFSINGLLTLTLLSISGLATHRFLETVETHHGVLKETGAVIFSMI